MPRMIARPVSSHTNALRGIRRSGIARPRDLAGCGIHPAQLARLVKAGVVERHSRGVYVVAGHEFSAEVAAATVAKRVPTAVLWLLTALRLHDLTTQLLHEVGIALPQEARRPALGRP